MLSCFPPYELKRSKDEKGQSLLWDPIRKRWFLEQPEEVVRQLLIAHLLEAHQVSRALIGVEKEITYHRQKKRLDVVVFDSEANPLVLCECKAPQVPLSHKTLQQLARYNYSLQAPHLLITNGLQLLFFSQDSSGNYQHMPDGWYH